MPKPIQNPTDKGKQRALEVSPEEPPRPHRTRRQPPPFLTPALEENTLHASPAQSKRGAETRK